ncbi:MAG: TetR/AcrR family transcriptional regulator [Saprospiraceae bacterium]|nr:TetR/AcrR family transcriptional regulator [Saprospiraceae bacterium]
MPSIATKSRIKEAAIACFNRVGTANVRLQQIADEAGMSLGNMTYHFRTREDILLSVWEQLVAEQRTLLNAFRVLPLFEDIERLLDSTFSLQQRYAFFYRDTPEVMRVCPAVEPEHRQHIRWQVQQLQLALEFNRARGAFDDNLLTLQQPEAVATLFWATADTWLYRCKITGDDETHYPAFQTILWNVLLPYFSDTGRREFRQLQNSQLPEV